MGSIIAASESCRIRTWSEAESQVSAAMALYLCAGSTLRGILLYISYRALGNVFNVAVTLRVLRHFFTSSIWHSTKRNLGKHYIRNESPCIQKDTSHLHASAFTQSFFNLQLVLQRPLLQLSISRKLILKNFSISLSIIRLSKEMGPIVHKGSSVSFKSFFFRLTAKMCTFCFFSILRYLVA